MVYSSGTGRTSVMGRNCKLSIAFQYTSTLLETNFIADVFSYVAEVISLKWARPSKWSFNELFIMT